MFTLGFVPLLSLLKIRLLRLCFQFVDYQSLRGVNFGNIAVTTSNHQKDTIILPFTWDILYKIGCVQTTEDGRVFSVKKTGELMVWFPQISITSVLSSPTETRIIRTKRKKRAHSKCVLFFFVKQNVKWKKIKKFSQKYWLIV